MQHHLLRQTRLDGWILRRIAEAEADQRQAMRGQPDQFRHRRNIVTQRADIDAAEAERFRDQQYVLRHDAGIHRTDQQRFRPIGLRFWQEQVVFVEIDAEKQKLRAFRHIGHVRRRTADAGTNRRIRDADDGHTLQMI